MTDNPEQLLFTSTAQAFLDKEVPLTRVRELHAAGIAFDADWWQRAAELGWASLLVPEEFGGGSVSGNGVDDLALLSEQAGRTVAPGPLHPVSVVLAGLVEAPEGHEATIEALVSGETVASWAVYEPGKGWAPTEPGLIAIETTDGFQLDGVKDRVEAGAESDVLLVAARCGDAVRQFLVPTDAAGVTIEAQQSIDMVKRYARVTFEGVQVGSNAAVGTAEQTSRLISRQAQIAQILQCTETVGILGAVLDFTIQWAFDRHSFGRPLASYQALKHQFADLKIEYETCRATTYAAAKAVAKDSPDAAVKASIAKSYVGEHASDMIQRCVQLHGGIGVTWEHDLHLYLRRAALNRSLFGTPEDHNLAVYAAEADKAAS
jgi:alkylation response protein AidB-like acyl-CoA dehydrogenase